MILMKYANVNYELSSSSLACGSGSGAGAHCDNASLRCYFRTSLRSGGVDLSKQHEKGALLSTHYVATATKSLSLFSSVIFFPTEFIIFESFSVFYGRLTGLVPGSDHSSLFRN